jgi:hypothetical protein
MNRGDAQVEPQASRTRGVLPAFACQVQEGEGRQYNSFHWVAAFGMQRFSGALAPADRLASSITRLFVDGKEH